MTETTKTLDYTPELFADVMADYLDYWQLGETVCGAEDPAVITLGEDFKTRRPELAQFSVCRVKERFVSAWKSDTFLEFSNRDITGDEYQAADDLTDAPESLGDRLAKIITEESPIVHAPDFSTSQGRIEWLKSFPGA